MRKILSILIFITLVHSATLAAGTWVTQTSGATSTLTINDVYTTEARAFIVGNQNILRSTTNQATWVEVSPETTTAHNLNAIDFGSSTTGYAVGDQPGGTPAYILKTTDSGVSFAGSNTPTAGQLSTIYDVSFVSATVGYISGHHASSAVGVYKTTDGGTSWNTTANLVANVNYYGIDFIDANTGWVVGNAFGAGTIYYTTDGGTTWIPSNAPAPADALNDVFFINSSVGWAVGDNGYIIISINGGLNWTVQTSGTTNNLNAVYFFDTNNGYAVGDSGTILQTTDGGTTWTTLTSGTTQNLNGVHFKDTNNGWAVGANATVLNWGATPSLTASPTFSAQGLTSTITLTAGSNSYFRSDATVTISGTGITYSSVRDSGTQITVIATVSASATTGSRTITVADSDGRSGTTSLAINAAPTISSIEDSSGYQDSSPSLFITGTSFQDGATVSFSPGTGTTGTSAFATTTISVTTTEVVSATGIRIGVTLASDQTAGNYNVTVTNPDQGVATLSDGFAVAASTSDPSLETVLGREEIVPYPCPWDPTTTPTLNIQVRSSGAGTIRLTLYDIGLRVVHAQDITFTGPGRRTITWDGMTGGTMISAGVYPWIASFGGSVIGRGKLTVVRR